MSKIHVEYGRCATDYEDKTTHNQSLQSLVSSIYREDKNAPQYLDEVFEDILLPFPDATKVHKGSEDLIAYLDDYGVVLRVSHQETSYSQSRFFDRMHPSILPYIGWVKPMRSPFYLSISPGAELAKSYFSFERQHRLKIEDELLKDMFVCTNEKGESELSAKNNLGYVTIGEKEYSVVLDDGGIRAENSKASSLQETFRNACYSQKMRVDDAYDHTLKSASLGRDWQAVIDYYKPLRKAFFDAYPGAHHGKRDVDPDKMKAFWNQCKKWKRDKKLHASWVLK